MSSPFRNTPSDLAKPACQSSSDISWRRRREPADVADLRAMDRSALEPPPAAEHRMAMPEPDQAARELEQRLVGVRPVVPRNLVVLAVCVVVALLRPADFVAADEHRHTLRQKQRGQEVPRLPGAERQDLGVVGRSFDAEIPRAIVALAVAVVLAVRLVVLLVVRNEIAQREAVVRGDEVDARVRPPRRPLIEVGAAR